MSTTSDCANEYPEMSGLRTFWKKINGSGVKFEDWKKRSIELRGLLAAMHPDDLEKCGIKESGSDSIKIDKYCDFISNNSAFVLFLNGIDGEKNNEKWVFANGEVEDEAIEDIKRIVKKINKDKCWSKHCTDCISSQFVNPIPPHPFMGSFGSHTKILFLGVNPQFDCNQEDSQDPVLTSFNGTCFNPWAPDTMGWKWHKGFWKTIEAATKGKVKISCEQICTLELFPYPTHNFKKKYFENDFYKRIIGEGSPSEKKGLPSQEMVLDVLRQIGKRKLTNLVIVAPKSKIKMIASMLGTDKEGSNLLAELEEQIFLYEYGLRCCFTPRKLIRLQDEDAYAKRDSLFKESAWKIVIDNLNN